MVSFELGKEIEKDVFFCLFTSMGPHEESNVIVREHRSAESEGLRFDSSWGLRIFSLSHARDKTKKKHLLLYPKIVLF